MVRKEKLALGLLVSLFTTPAVLAETVIGTYKTDAASATTSRSENNTKNETNKTEESKGTASDQKDTAIPANLQKTESADSGKITGATGILQTSGTNGVDIKIEGTPVASKSDVTPGEMTDSQLEKKVTDILIKNPEIIVGALQKFNQNQQRVQQEKLEASLMKYQGEISKESGAVVLGKKDAEVKLVVFLDPNCPHCRPFSQALNKVREDFPNVSILMRHWAILGKDSEDVVRGLWAIKQQGQDKFNAATKAIASSEERYTSAKLLAWVEEHNLDVAKFKEDSESQATKDVIDETKKLASDLGLEGTPTSLLVDKKGIRLVMPTDEKSLESILKGATKA